MLDVVQLSDAADERVKGYSLGMRQRLGIAAALLKQPSVLILDEPSNGLDPAGMREVRQLLRALGDSGVTVLLSSHLLGEVQQICDTVTIINHGRVVTAGTGRRGAAVAVDRGARGRHRRCHACSRRARRRGILGTHPGRPDARRSSRRTAQ